MRGAADGGGRPREAASPGRRRTSASSTGRTSGSSSTATARSRSPAASSRLHGRLRRRRGARRHTCRRPHGRLGDDVVIVGRPRRAARRRTRDLPLAARPRRRPGRRPHVLAARGSRPGSPARVRVTTAAGRHARGAGHDPRRHGHLLRRSASGSPSTAVGSSSTDPLDNPALDIVALRKNLAVEAGVEVTGTVKVPRIQLISNPPVPDGEKLSWLMTGQGLDRASGADVAALPAASAVAARSGRQADHRDDRAAHRARRHLGARAPPVSVTGRHLGRWSRSASGISDRLTLVYEQGLIGRHERAAASNTR